MAIATKIVEEAHEVVESATRPKDSFSPDHLRHEAADLVYHLCVALAYHDIDWSDVERELECRSRRSGLAEKASRMSMD